MAHELPKLPYSFDALEPYIDKATMELHHGKHHAAYVAKLNAALEKHPDIASLPVDGLIRDLSKIPADIRTAVINHGGGHSNHSFFWRILGPGAGGEPTGPLLDSIKATFSTFEGFRDKLTAAAANHFGSGWAWLVLDPKSGLELTTTPNQESPLSAGKIPLVGIDVWEHAYYLKYQNRRPEYLSAIWNVINWKEVERRFGEGQ